MTAWPGCLPIVLPFRSMHNVRRTTFSIPLRRLSHPLRRWLFPLLSALVLLAALPAAPALAQAPGSSAVEEFAQRMKEALQRLVVPPSVLTDGPQVRAAFHEVVAAPSQWTVRLLHEDKPIALGVVVASDGWVLTKASLLASPVVCQLKDGRKLAARVVGLHKRFDLAMLKIEANDLPSAAWQAGSVRVGQWLATPGLGAEPIAVGVLSVGQRAIAKRSGMLGIRLGPTSGGVLVVEVLPGSGAAEAGVKKDDVVTGVNGRKTSTPQELIRAVRSFEPGEQVELSLLRGEETIKVTARLTDGVPGIRLDRRDIQESMGSELSKRRGGFPAVLQHDSLLKPEDCGGPIVDLDGKAVGVNIARAGRTESYAVPARTVLILLPELMSGKLAPPTDPSETAATAR